MIIPRDIHRSFFGFVIVLWSCCVLSAVAFGQDQVKPGQSMMIPHEVVRAAYGADILKITDLPPIQIESAKMTVESKAYGDWHIVHRSGNFTIVRMTDDRGHSRYSSYVGPQALNQAWFTPQAGRQTITALAGSEKLLPPLNIMALDGVLPDQLGFTVTFKSDGHHGQRETRTTRRVLEADVIAAMINEKQYLLRSFLVEVITEEKRRVKRTLSRVQYVPILGMALQGERILPTRKRWKFEDIRVTPEFLKEVATVAMH